MTTPRDPAVDAVLTAETLLAQFRALVPRLTSVTPADVSVAMGEAQSLYPEIWATLDRGRAVLRERGIDVPVFDEARARQPAAMLGVNVHVRDRSSLEEAATMTSFLLGGVTGVVVGTAIDVAGAFGAKQGEANRGGLHDAALAVQALRDAMPEVDWKAIRTHEARATASLLDDLARARQRKLVMGFAGGTVIVLICIALVTLFQRSKPLTEEEQLARDQEEISELNATLRETPCDAKAAERRVRIFEAHQRTRTARRLAKEFLASCGDHAYLKSVAR